jgi:hypothetical protein
MSLAGWCGQRRISGDSTWVCRWRLAAAARQRWARVETVRFVLFSADAFEVFRRRAGLLGL